MREDGYFLAAAITENSGTGFAFPSQTVSVNFKFGSSADIPANAASIVFVGAAMRRGR